jgi:arginine exporter protein ArgO
MLSALGTGLLAGYGAAVPIGAIAALLISLSARTSLRVGASAALGVATVDGCYALAGVLGGSALGALIQRVAGPMRWIAGAVLIAVAVRTATAAILAYRRRDLPVAVREQRVRTPLRAYLTLIGLTALNPMTIVYFGALVLGRQAAGEAGGLGAVFVLAVFVASASWQLVLACGGRLLGRVLDAPKGRLVTALVAAVVVLVLAVRLLAGQG